MKKLTILLILLLLLGLSTYAQEGSFTAPPESGLAFGLSISEGTFQVGQLQQSFGGTIDIDYNPADPRRWARVDNFGIMRFVDINNPSLAEGVYTFPPLFNGFEAPSAAGNKYFIREVEWSPDGRSLAFRIENPTQLELNQGVWFWQPLQELSTDPSYQLLRPCPGFCDQAGVPSSYAGWRALSLSWSSDSATLLITVNALEAAGRRALLVRSAQRTDPPPATQAPNFLLYDYGTWAVDGQRLVVSGHGPEDTILFGTVDRSGANPIVRLATDIGMAWVQDAVQAADGNILMLGSTVGQLSPLQIIDQDGNLLSPLIGERYPDTVKWSPDRSAVMLRIGEEVYIAQSNGTVYEISDLLRDGAGNISPNVEWVNGTLPNNFSPIPLPEPVAEGEVTPEATEISGETQVFAVGDLLRLNVGTLNVFAEPIATASIVGELTAGDELIVTDGPVQAGNLTWYRIQSLNYTGWINDTSNLVIPPS